jgi:DNA-binding HxlR family transcriptional regulator
MDKARERLAARFDCPLYTALSVLGGRWKALILWNLLEDGTHRFLALQRKLAGVSQKVLSQQLRELERDGLVQKTVFAVVPPHTEYRATPLAETVRPVLSALCNWGDAQLARRSASMYADVG